MRIDLQAYKPRNAKVGQKWPWSTSRDLLFYILGAARYLRFGSRIHRLVYKPKKCKSRSKGACCTSRDLLFVMLERLYISGMGKAADLKFSVQIELKARKPKNAKLGQ